MLQRERRCNLATAIQTRKQPYRDRIELLQVTLDIKVALLQTNNRTVMISRMQAVADDVFKALADPTRQAIFERLARDGEQTVHALTEGAGVSQPAVSKHLGVLK